MVSTYGVSSDKLFYEPADAALPARLGKSLEPMRLFWMEDVFPHSYTFAEGHLYPGDEPGMALTSMRPWQRSFRIVALPAGQPAG